MKKLYELRLNENIVTGLLIEKTWLELKTLRDSGNLVPGQQYRITDYVATTNGNMDSRSANHPFDIIVTADDERTLNEHARTIMHETVFDFSSDTQCEVGYFYKYNGSVYKCVTAHTGEWNANDFTAESPYFYGCDLAAWDVWYCLDNDTNRFAWALGEGETDSQTGTTGRGVLYRLIDEFQNDVPYDFKGIQFCRWAITNITSAKFDNNSLNSLKSSFVKANNGGLYYAYQSSNITIKDTAFAVNSSDSVWYFTFGGTEDLSLTGFNNSIYANKIAEYISSNKCSLNNIIFLGSNCYSNTFDINCYSNTFGSRCYSNTFDINCYSNTFGSRCYSNTFDSYCSSNTFSSNCYSNIFGSDCRSNIFGSNCNSNIFGLNYYSNIFGLNCDFNTFGSYCSSNTFGSNCSYNTFDSDCISNTFGSYCNFNTFGLGCYYNIFGSNCSYNIFGSDCISNIFGSNYYAGSQNKEFVPLSYYRYIELEDGVSYVALDCTADRGDGVYYQNVTVSKGNTYTESAPKHIEDANSSQSFKTTYQPANSQVINI